MAGEMVVGAKSAWRAMMCAGALTATCTVAFGDNADTIFSPFPIANITPEMLELANMNRIGGGVMFEPSYPGSSSFRVRPLPDIDVTFEKRYFANTTDGAGVYIYNDNGFSVGPSIFVRQGRGTDRDEKLRGLAAIPWTPQARFAAQYDTGLVSLGAAVIHDFGGTDGTELELRFQTVIPLSDKLFILPGLTVTLADKHFMRGWFGVSRAESVTSGYMPYRPAGGFESLTGSLNIAYRFDTNWVTYIKTDFKYLGSGPGNSPFVTSRFQPTIGVGISYLFK